jgi:hypothetical protein
MRGWQMVDVGSPGGFAGGGVFVGGNFGSGREGGGFEAMEPLTDKAPSR